MADYWKWDHHFVVGNLIPLIKRKIKTIDWLYALTFPIKEKQTEIFIDGFYEDNINIANYQSNRISFEHILNDNFGLTYSVGYTGSIWIEHPLDSLQISYMYNESETLPSGGTYAYMYNKNEIGKDIDYIWNEVELDSVYDFTVNSPTSIQTSEKRLKSLINRIKLLDKFYNINYF